MDIKFHFSNTYAEEVHSKNTWMILTHFKWIIKQLFSFHSSIFFFLIFFFYFLRLSSGMWSLILSFFCFSSTLCSFFGEVWKQFFWGGVEAALPPIEGALGHRLGHREMPDLVHRVQIDDGLKQTHATHLKKRREQTGNRKQDRHKPQTDSHCLPEFVADWSAAPFSSFRW